MSNFIENAQWRYATKKYDSTKKVSNDDLETLKKAVQLSASSFGLQPYREGLLSARQNKLQGQVSGLV